MMGHFRTLRWSAWLGWQIEGNWTRPWLFVLYLLVRPLASSLLLVCMYWAARAATASKAPAGFLPFLYVGSACYMLVVGVTFGMSYAVVSDRDQYGMLKFIRMSPVWLQTYLVGRGLGCALQAGIGVVLTLGLGLLLLRELRAAVGSQGIAWAWLGVYLVTGMVLFLALGLILAGAVLNLPRHGMFLSEAVAGVLYLLSGVVFPIDILPTWLQPVSLALPTTYWLQGMRLSLLGPGSLSSALNAWQPGQLAVALIAGTVALCVVAWRFFRWSERRAWRLGRFDENSGY